MLQWSRVIKCTLRPLSGDNLGGSTQQSRKGLGQVMTTRKWRAVTGWTASSVKVQTPGPQNVILFRDRVFKEVIKLK